MEDKIVATPSTVIVNGALSGSVDWAVVALEIKPETGMGKSSPTAGNTALVPPAEFKLEQNYPNPFNPSTVISFELPAVSQVTLQIYSNTGQLIHTLVAGEKASGRHTVRWDGRNQSGHYVAAGMYICRLVVQGEDGGAVFKQTRRMSFLQQGHMRKASCVILTVKRH